MFLINIYASQGTGLNKTDKIVQEVEEVLFHINDINHFASNICKGNPRIFYNVFSEFESSHYAQIFVELKQYEEKKFRHLISDLRKTFKNYPDASISVKELEHGPSYEAPIVVRIIGLMSPRNENPLSPAYLE